MKRPVRHNDGKYHLDGNAFKELFGSRQQVWNRTSYKTPGGLRRKELMMNKWGRIVSKKKHATAKREHKQKKRLFAKFTAKKGKFGAVRRDGKGVKKTKKNRRRRRGTKRGGEGLLDLGEKMKELMGGEGEEEEVEAEKDQNNINGSP